MTRACPRRESLTQMVRHSPERVWISRRRQGSKAAKREVLILRLLEDGAWAESIALRKRADLDSASFSTTMEALIYDGIVERDGTPRWRRYRRAPAWIIGPISVVGASIDLSPEERSLIMEFPGASKHDKQIAATILVRLRLVSESVTVDALREVIGGSQIDVRRALDLLSAVGLIGALPDDDAIMGSLDGNSASPAGEATTVTVEEGTLAEDRVAAFERAFADTRAAWAFALEVKTSVDKNADLVVALASEIEALQSTVAHLEEASVEALAHLENQVADLRSGRERERADPVAAVANGIGALQASMAHLEETSVESLARLKNEVEELRSRLERDREVPRGTPLLPDHLRAALEAKPKVAMAVELAEWKTTAAMAAAMVAKLADDLQRAREDLDSERQAHNDTQQRLANMTAECTVQANARQAAEALVGALNSEVLFLDRYRTPQQRALDEMKRQDGFVPRGYQAINFNALPQAVKNALLAMLIPADQRG